MDTSKKIIRGVVNSRGFTITSPITQWDYGWQFIPEIEDLPATYRLDFSNGEHHGTALPVYCSTDGAEVPTELIDTGKDVWVWLFNIGEGYGITEYKWRIPNKCKPKTEQDEPTPSQQSSIDQAISALNTAVAHTAQDVISADQSARSASDDADRAEQAKEDASTFAQRSANSAQASADYSESAQASATASANSASQSAQIKADVEDLADDAQSYAQSAEQSAQNAHTYALSANAASGTAENFADVASGYASQAQSSAQTASAKAQEASGYAQTASAKATESAQSASQALGYKNDAESAKTASQTAQGLAESARDTAVSAKTDAESARDDAETARDEAQSAVASISGALAEKAPVITDTASGAIASFTDGADDLPLKSLVVDINPVQDLHGQDSPWPAGGGKNLFDPSVYSAYLQSDGKYRAKGSQINPIYIPIPSTLLNTECTFSFYADMTNAGTLTNVLTQAVVGGVSKNGNLVQNGSIGRSTVTFTPTSESDYIHITFGSNGANEFTFYNIQLEASSAVTDYAPYENLCPITGWTGVNIQRNGTNFFDGEMENGDINANTGESSGTSSSRYRSKNYIPIRAGSYYFKSPNRTTVRVFFYDKDKNFLWFTSWNANAVNTFTSEKIRYMRFRFPTGKIDGDEQISINSPSSVTDYAPYQGQSIPINWADEAGTVYGGKLDVLSGELVIDRAMVDLGTLTYVVNNHATLGQYFYAAIDALGVKYEGAFGSRLYNVLCSAYKVVIRSPKYLVNGTFCFDGTQASEKVTQIQIKNTAYTDAIAFKAAMSGVQLCYELAEPIEIQLSANQINSLYGQNNIWADSGDTEVEYRADTKLFIERLTAPDSADMIADSNIVSGQYFMVGNSLYKATANIASGSAVIVGTNATRKSLSEALNEINA